MWHNRKYKKLILFWVVGLFSLQPYLYALPDVLLSLDLENQKLVESSCLEYWGENWENEFEVSALSGGLSGAGVFRFKGKEQDCVLRVSPDYLTEQECIDAAKAMEAVAKLNSAPNVCFLSPGARLMIMEFFKGSTLHPYDFKDETMLTRVARTMASVHSAKAEIGSSAFDMWLSGIDWFEKAKQENRLKIPAFIEAYDQWKEVTDLLNKFPLEKGVCHGDPNSLNILYTDLEMKLIDWDFAYSGILLKELAFVCNFYDFSPEQESMFLSVYLGREMNATERSLLYMCRVVGYLELAMHSLQWLDDTGSTNISFDLWNEYYDIIDSSFFYELVVAHAEKRLEINEEWSRNYSLTSFKKFMERINSDTFRSHWDYLNTHLPQ